MIPAPISPQERRENPDPYEQTTPIPWAVLILVAIMVGFGMVYILTAGLDGRVELGDNRTLGDLTNQPAAARAASKGDGAAIFAARCAACHQASGEGLAGVFPPLAGSEWVTSSGTLLAKILLHGVQGAVTVKGATYGGAMPAFKDQLDDEAIAAVATYARAQWGNSAPPVTAETVAAARADSASRSAPWNGDTELAAMK